jgi:uncharacterized small protein (TIGR04563 family)
MPGADKRKQSLYFPEDMLQEIQQEAARMDRSLSGLSSKVGSELAPRLRRFHRAMTIRNLSLICARSSFGHGARHRW